MPTRDPVVTMWSPRVGQSGAGGKQQPPSHSGRFAANRLLGQINKHSKLFGRGIFAFQFCWKAAPSEENKSLATFRF